MKKEKILEIINYLDVIASHNDQRYSLYIAGGAAFVLKEIINRQTEDIDVFRTMNKKIEGFLLGLDIDTKISNIIKNTSFMKYSDSIKDINLEKINVYIVNQEYLFVLKCLAISSLFRSEDEKRQDIEDLKQMNINSLNKDMIKNIISDISQDSLTNIDIKLLEKEVRKWIK